MGDSQGQIVSSLLSKLALASSPGMGTTGLYFSSQNSDKELIMSQSTYGKFSQTLANVNWGGSNQIVIPSAAMISNVYLQFKATVPAGVFNEAGLGYMLLDSLSYIWGSTNTSQIQLPRTGIIAAIMRQCGTAEQASEFWYQAGAGTLTGETASERVVEGCIMLPLPWSTSCPMVKPPFDSSMLAGSAPIILRIDLTRSPTECFGHIGGDANIVRNARITEANVIFNMVELGDTSLSLANQLRADPSLVVSYSFIHYQVYNSRTFTASATPGVVGNWGGYTTELQSVDLTSFIRSDLLSITFMLTDSADGSMGTRAPLTTQKAGRFNPIEMLDFELLFNGQRLVYSPGNGSVMRLLGMKGREGSSYFEGTDTSGTGGITTSSPTYTYLTHYEASYKGSQGSCNEFSLSNVGRFANMVLTARFRTPLVTRTVAPTYQLSCLYSYQALSEVNSQGQVNIIFS